jgi:hypothetical protein
MRLSYVVAYPSWLRQVLCFCVSYLDGLSVCARFVVLCRHCVVDVCVSVTLGYPCCGVTVFCICVHVIGLVLFFTFGTVFR